MYNRFFGLFGKHLTFSQIKIATSTISIQMRLRSCWPCCCWIELDKLFKNNNKQTTTVQIQTMCTIWHCYCMFNYTCCTVLYVWANLPRRLSDLLWHRHDSSCCVWRCITCLCVYVVKNLEPWTLAHYHIMNMALRLAHSDTDALWWLPGGESVVNKLINIFLFYKKIKKYQDISSLIYFYTFKIKIYKRKALERRLRLVLTLNTQHTLTLT